MYTLQRTLSDLRMQIITVQQLEGEDADQVKDQLSGLLAGLQRTFEALQSIAAELPTVEHGASNGSAAGNGGIANDARPSSFVSSVSDASGRALAEQEIVVYQERLRALTADLLLAEESERRRLAVDLHDGLSQSIALLQIKITALRKSMEGKLTEDLNEIQDLIQETDRATRSISFELSPPMLHDLGLEPAVQWLVENIQSRYDVEIVLENDGDSKPTAEKTRLILFRSIRELLINAAKHARAQRVHVRLQRDEGQLNALIEDDGIGMEPGVAIETGFGLFSIQERLAHVGGSMRIQSAPGEGTKIHLRAPLLDSNTAKAR